MARSDVDNWTGPMVCYCMACEASKCYITINTRTKMDTYVCKACGFKAIHYPASDDTPLEVVHAGNYPYRSVKVGDKLFS